MDANNQTYVKPTKRIMTARNLLVEEFKKEFGDDWKEELRDFEHGFSSFYDATISAINKALELSKES